MYPSLVYFAFSTFFISVFSTKILHLYLNAGVFPFGVLFFCLPAFLVTDVILICAVWLLLRPKNSVPSAIGFCAAYIICFITLGAASSQFSFYYHTGGELEWGDAGSFAMDAEGRKVLLSGSGSAIAAACAIMTFAWFAKTLLYKFVGGFVTSVESEVISRTRSIATRLSARKSTNKEDRGALLPTSEYPSDDDDDDDSTDSDDDSNTWFDSEDGTSSVHKPRYGRLFSLLMACTACMSLFGVFVILDSSRPYGRMMSTLPLPLLAAFMPKGTQCSTSAWPLPQLIEKINWENPNGDFKGWAPGTDNHIVRAYKERIPPWLPSPVPSGFKRWRTVTEKVKGIDFGTLVDDQEELDNLLNDKKKNKCAQPLVQDDNYNPAADPLRITNLDLDVLQPLQNAFKDASVKIKHIALIQMESMREELFPIQQGSDIYKFILNSNKGDEQQEQVDALLSVLTPNAEKITGKSGGFTDKEGSEYAVTDSATDGEWEDKTKPGYGGINIVGGLTASSVSTKSLASSHCGVWPMPIDMFEEATVSSYQPCIPQVLGLFNQMKGNWSRRDFREQRWNPAFFASVTDTYDRQNIFERKIGFEHTVARARISEDQEDLEELNYFGFPETVLESYLREYINESISNNQRMFLSHFTSTTHHPFKTPASFQTVDYMGAADAPRSKHQDFNDYLNTIRFTDAWLGTMMSMFDELGIANETLVVFVGDHGQAFKEDVRKTGTYDNGHVSNFRVPITFRHPLLPRVQYNANATSVSILPTILDLLINTNSLNQKDTIAAKDIVQDYEGQSLIRPYKTNHHGRRAWNFGIVNPGGKMLTVTSADAPWRLVMPIHGKDTDYIFTDLKGDPLELKPLTKWSVRSLKPVVLESFGQEAADWLEEAAAVAKWWVQSRPRLWGYVET